MKKETKKLLFALLTGLLVVTMCLAITGCGNTQTEETTPLGTLPAETTASAETTTLPETTAAETTTTVPEETTTTTVQPPIYTGTLNPLTGMPSSTDLSGTRPVAIVVDNIKNAYRYQAGLGQADILYEALTSPGITRFLALYADYNAVESVCNIREASVYHLDLAAFHNALLVAYGGRNGDGYSFDSAAYTRYGNNNFGYINASVEPWFCQAESGEKYGTIAHKGARVDLAYDTVFKPAALSALLKSTKYSKFVANGGTINGTPGDSLKFVPYGTVKSMAGASDATAISLSFDKTKTVAFSYDSSTKKYLRAQDGGAHIDSATGDQLAFTNVITLFTATETVETGIKNDPKMTKVVTRGENFGYYFYGGKVIQIKWWSDGATLTLEDPNGNELTLATGNTYIGFLDEASLKGPFWY